MNDFPVEKSALRKAMLARRKAIPEAIVNASARACSGYIADWLRAVPGWGENLRVLSYAAFKNEFPTEEINALIRREGNTLLLPYTDEAFCIRPLVITDDAAFRVSAIGVTEPDIARCREADPREIDLVLMPGVAFDRQGFRIGFGKGCYDRFLPKLRPDVPAAALAYDFQVLDAVPHEAHDRPCNLILTEKGRIDCR